MELFTGCSSNLNVNYDKYYVSISLSRIYFLFVVFMRLIKIIYIKFSDLVCTVRQITNTFHRGFSVSQFSLTVDTSFLHRYADSLRPVFNFYELWRGFGTKSLPHGRLIRRMRFLRVPLQTDSIGITEPNLLCLFLLFTRSFLHRCCPSPVRLRHSQVSKLCHSNSGWLNQCAIWTFKDQLLRRGQLIKGHLTVYSWPLQTAGIQYLKKREGHNGLLSFLAHYVELSDNPGHNVFRTIAIVSSANCHSQLIQTHIITNLLTTQDHTTFIVL